MHQIHENNDNKPNTKKIRSQEAYRKHLYNYSKKSRNNYSLHALLIKVRKKMCTS